jgi:3-methyladenine DNA glycosylase/8-oxoguanine DNA glycosylase
MDAWTCPAARRVTALCKAEPDAFPATDLGLLRGAALINGPNISPASLLRRAESGRPWRAYAAQHLWTAGGKGNNPHVTA